MKLLRLKTLFLLFVLPLIAKSQSNLSADFDGGVFLCEKQLIQIPSLPDAGTNGTETAKITCFTENPFTETNAIWFRWEIASAGSLDFTILPFLPDDDFDFVLFRVEGEEFSISALNPVRCMRAGPSLGTQEPVSCLGATGLQPSAGSIQESPGCNQEKSMFLDDIQVQAGEKWALLVNNFRSSGGFALDFGGNCAFAPSVTGCETSDKETNGALMKAGFDISDIYPNPVAESLHFTVSADKGNDLLVQLVSSNGYIASSQSFSVASGDTPFTLPVSHLSSGVWFIKVSTPELTSVSRFFKN